MKTGSATIVALGVVFVAIGIFVAAPKAMEICLYLAGGLVVTGALLLGFRWWSRR